MFLRHLLLFFAFVFLLSCVFAVCGNSVVETGEACDDGNTRIHDGCDASCQVETNFKGDVIWDCSTPGEPCSWIPPIGIPKVPFGIEESHWMYASLVGGGRYFMGPDGPYTYFVDNSPGAGCSNSGNVYGSEARPRCDFPSYSTLLPGDVVYVNGGTYGSGSFKHVNGAVGTAAQPIFIRGNPDNKPKITWKWIPDGGTKYVIFENLDMDGTVNGIGYAAFQFGDSKDVEHGGLGGCDHVVLRYSELHHNAATNVRAGTGSEYIVVFGVSIHDNGGSLYRIDDWDAEAVVVGGHVSNFWILDSTMYNNTGSCIQLNPGSFELLETLNHIYIGRNHNYQCRQAGVAMKQSIDIVISQNLLHDMISTNQIPDHKWTSLSKGVGFQYGPKRVWILFNDIYNCELGVNSGSSNAGTGEYIYLIGNKIHDLHAYGAFDPNNAWSYAGATLVGIDDKGFVVGNTIYNTTAGVNYPGSGGLVISNNIIFNLSEPEGKHIFLDTPAAAAASSMSHNLIYQNGLPARIGWGHGTQVKDLSEVPCTGCMNANPLLDSLLKPQPESPAINNGILDNAYQAFWNQYHADYAALGSEEQANINFDFDGNPRDSQPDIGAFEFQGPLVCGGVECNFGEICCNGQCTVPVCTLASGCGLGEVCVSPNSCSAVCEELECSEGAIASACYCGGSLHSSGYCCSNVW
ncbi:MAG: hypothetical protein JW772_00640, partial [Candidatus Diapherotrites archaeon]|nr:hypothetical protein [Candidatus Diapherotrites archaeon]